MPYSPPTNQAQGGAAPTPEPTVTASAPSLWVRGLLHPFIAFLTLLVFLAIAAGLYSGLSKQNQAQIEANLANEAQAMANHLEREFRIHSEAIQRMAARLEAAPDTDESRWRKDARQYMQHFSVYQAVEWIDRDFFIRWLEPIAGNEDVLGFNVAFSEQRLFALEHAAASGQLDVSGVIDLRQGGKGLVIYAPVGAGADNNGFIAGVIRMDVLARQLLTSRVKESFSIEILSHGKPSHLLNDSGQTSKTFAQAEAVDLPGLNWSLILHPTTDWVAAQRSHWPFTTFVSLALMGLLLSLSMILVQIVLKRNQDLLKTRRQLDREIDQRTVIQQNLARAESTDPLTGLANRRFFTDDLAHGLTVAERQKRKVALVMMDLDRFQMLNDSLGHVFGDELLVSVAERLDALSSERVVVAYAGGDEFMVCLQQVTDLDEVLHLLGDIKECFDEPFTIQGDPLGITATMGVAVYPQSGTNADALMRNADIALYRAKDRGRNCYQFYTEGMQEREVARLELDKDLTHALAQDEFVLHFQPQLDLDNGEINGVEALIRWQHPRRGLLMPIDFIPLAEESGRITDIGRWVVLAACRQLARWKGTPLEHLRIAVNLSGRELDDPHLVDHIRDTLEINDVPARRLEIELTEEIFIQNIECNLSQLTRLRELGVHLAIDDFGVGYSSLGYLRDFPVDVLKIDRSFISNVTTRHDDAVITRAVINLAHNLGMQVVAEGVETEQQLNFLRSYRCNLVQGYLISKPVPAEALNQAMATGAEIAGITVDSGL
ncbi:bifunctional diguanylate cyclase/phosphodiesterase [Marinobacter salinisoli]|uniref:Bifunctional diguanylate cyclase/phosphodiesterase n=1 Tax=Marinobacter salinisoli TaxID=2769486 RepID=A0ABX7MWE7_9GAMM|nr:EAL domain-containing protein [Marinobacter salinisoli]QSP95426.1 bifunctional diguanylate cyclase/phosphodiesterase [Marinobacter salinisoli]